MLEGQEMRILGGLYHFLLFLIISWTVYNTFAYICLILPPSNNKYVELNIFGAWNFYLLGALNFHHFIRDISDILHNLIDPWVLCEFWPFLIYSFMVNGLAALNWCNNQNPLSACFLALAPCLAGPHLALVFRDYRFLFFGIIGIVAFYGIMLVLNRYRKKRWPKLSLPAWLEWRRPNMVPSLKSIADKMERMFR